MPLIKRLGSLKAAASLTVIPLALGAMWANSFKLAYTCVSAVGFCWLCAYLSSNFLENRRVAEGYALIGLVNSPQNRFSNFRILQIFGSFGIVATTGACIGWVYDAKLQYVRSEVYAKLDISCTALPGSKQPHTSIISIKNNSPFEISGRHRTFCFINREVSERYLNGGISNIGFMKNPMGGWMIYTEPLDSLPRDVNYPPIRAGGESQSDTCIDALMPYDPVSSTREPSPACIDMTIIFQYEISSQQDNEQRKVARFKAYHGDAGYIWEGEPSATSMNYCDGSK